MKNLGVPQIQENFEPGRTLQDWMQIAARGYSFRFIKGRNAFDAREPAPARSVTFPSHTASNTANTDSMTEFVENSLHLMATTTHSASGISSASPVTETRVVQQTYTLLKFLFGIVPIVA